MILETIKQPADLRRLSYAELDDLAGEIRDFIVHAVAETGGHLGSNLGAVELTLALHRVFDSPRDAILWDTGPPGLRAQDRHRPPATASSTLRQAGGLSGYPSREQSPSTTSSRTATPRRSCRYALRPGRRPRQRAPTPTGATSSRSSATAR